MSWSCQFIGNSFLCYYFFRKNYIREHLLDKLNTMNADLLKNILIGYENQLTNAEIKKDLNAIEWLKAQIHEAKICLATMSIRN